MDKRLRQLNIFLMFYFAPWGAAKGSIWEDVIGGEVDGTRAQQVAKEILNGDRIFSPEDMRFIQIVIT